MPTAIQEAQAPASQPLLPKWANAQDGWCRALVADVLKNAVQASDLDIDRYLQQFLSEKKLSREPFVDVAKIERLGDARTLSTYFRRTEGPGPRTASSNRSAGPRWILFA